MPRAKKCSNFKYKYCSALPVECLKCSIDRDPSAANCVYGEFLETDCSVDQSIECMGPRAFKRAGICRFCYQTPDWMQVCTPMTTCWKSDWIRLHTVNCTVEESVVCLGNRAFNKRVECNWTSGHKWNVAMTLSLTLGGFGVDRFYLGFIKVGGSSMIDFLSILFCLFVQSCIFKEGVRKIAKLWWSGIVDSNRLDPDLYWLCGPGRWIYLHLVLLNWSVIWCIYKWKWRVQIFFVII